MTDPNPAPKQSSQRAAGGRAPSAPPPPKKPSVLEAAVHDIQRLREIAAVLARHGFAELLERAGLEAWLGDLSTLRDAPDAGLGDDPRDSAIRLRRVLEELGATFVKLGQILSTRHDLLPQAMIEEFEKLQDQVPPMPLREVRAQIERGLGGPLETFFANFEPTPLAAASIGQAHRAVTAEGRPVVVKVQRQGIAAQIQGDLDLLHFLSRLLEATIEEVGVYNLTEIVREFDRSIRMEIDFLHEARNLRRMRAAHADDPKVRIPEAFEALSCPTVLTLEFLEGRRPTELEPDSPQARDIARVLLEVGYEQIFVHGLFHADPHPGNLLVMGPQQLGMLDFGLVGQLSRAQQDDLVALLITLIYGDIDGTARALLRMGQPQGRVDLSALKRDVADLRERYLGRTLGELDLRAFTADLMDAALRHRLKLNSEYALLAKATVTLEGVLRRLSPSLDLMEAAAPLARRLLAERYSSRRVLQDVLQGATTLSGFLKDIPAQMDQILMDLESGTVAVHVHNDQIQQLGPNLEGLGSRLFLGMVCAGLLTGGAVLLTRLDAQVGERPVFLWLGLGFLALAALLSVATLGWPWVKARLKPIKLGPWLRILRRQARWP